MKNWLKLILIFIIIVGYIIIINIFASLISISYENYEIYKSKLSGGSILEINIKESVSVHITRPRWYGTIYENNGNSFLHLFNLILLPNKIKKYNFIWFHIIFLTNLCLFLMLIFKRKVYKEEKPNLEYDKVVL